MEKTSKKERRAEMREVMKNLDVKNMADINELFKEMDGRFSAGKWFGRRA